MSFQKWLQTSLALIAAVSVLLIAADGAAEDPSGDKAVYIMTVNDAIGPGIADFIIKGIARANERGAAVLIIELDTPGGLAESMRSIVKAILASKVTVVVYVSPGGARAASAGVMITMAADIAAMAPGTNIGAAHPVGAGGQEISKTMSDKVVNDMVAQARSVAEQRGRNADWVEKAIRESVSATEKEALKENIVNLVAKDLDDLVRQLEGRNVKEKGTLAVAGAPRVVLEENLRTRVLKTISDPNIAYILLMVGLAGLYFELSHPGAVFPGVIGGISIILAFFALQALPINTVGILLILLALVFFILEMKIASYGLLSIAGVISLVLGSLMMFDSESTGLRLSWAIIGPTIAMISGFFVVVAGLVFRSQVSRPQTGAGGLVNDIGIVKQALTPEGKVFVHGELWHAVAGESIEEGAKVKVVGVKNLTLEVVPADDPEKNGPGSS
jgi:membrane-bound serine protease (ClpP class)